MAEVLIKSDQVLYKHDQSNLYFEFSMFFSPIIFFGFANQELIIILLLISVSFFKNKMVHLHDNKH